MLKRPLLLVILLLLLFLSAPKTAYSDEAQKAWLRMYASGSEYVYDNPDDWIAYSYVIKSGSSSLSLTIDVTNHNGPTDKDIRDIVLLIVTNDIYAIASIIIDLNTVSLAWIPGPDPTGPSMYTDPGPSGGTHLGDMPAHGVYNDQTASWVEYRSGTDLGPRGSSISFDVTITFTSPDPGDVKIHFDTYGWVEESGKKPVIVDDKLDAAFSPFSHDITITVPEFPLTLIIISLGVCSYLLLKRKSTK